MRKLKNSNKSAIFLIALGILMVCWSVVRGDFFVTGGAGAMLIILGLNVMGYGNNFLFG